MNLQVFLSIIVLVLVSQVYSTPVKESECLAILESILHHPCKHLIISKFVLASNNNLFEEICQQFVSTIETVNENYPGRTCKYTKPLTDIVTRITKDEKSARLVLSDHEKLGQLVTFFAEFGPEHLEEFLEILEVDPKSFRNFLSECYELVLTVDRETSGRDYVNVILHVARLIRTFREKKVEGYDEAVIMSLFELSRESPKIVLIISTWICKMVKVTDGGVLMEVIQVIIGLAQELTDEEANDTESTIDSICSAIYEIIVNHSDSVDGSRAKIRAFTEFIANLLNNEYGSLIGSFAKMISKYYCKQDVNSILVQV